MCLKLETAPLEKKCVSLRTLGPFPDERAKEFMRIAANTYFVWLEIDSFCDV